MDWIQWPYFLLLNGHILSPQIIPLRSSATISLSSFFLTLPLLTLSLLNLNLLILLLLNLLLLNLFPSKTCTLLHRQTFVTKWPSKDLFAKTHVPFSKIMTNFYHQSIVTGKLEEVGGKPYGIRV